jgi:hypothetical protein
MFLWEAGGKTRKQRLTLNLYKPAFSSGAGFLRWLGGRTVLGKTRSSGQALLLAGSARVFLSWLMNEEHWETVRLGTF